MEGRCSIIKQINQIPNTERKWPGGALKTFRNPKTPIGPGQRERNTKGLSQGLALDQAATIPSVFELRVFDQLEYDQLHIRSIEHLIRRPQLFNFIGL